MPKEELDRVIAALKRLMEPVDGKEGSSEYARIAGYHGFPNKFCHHGQETFPGWHRAFMVEMEKALQVADKALGTMSPPAQRSTHLYYGRGNLFVPRD